jgi:hypothetical protein
VPVGGQVPVEVEVVGRSGCKGSWWANGGPGKVGGVGSKLSVDLVAPLSYFYYIFYYCWDPPLAPKGPK